MQESWDTQVRLLGWEDPLEDKIEPTPVKFHGQRSLVDYSPWGCNDMDTAKVT